ncbi:DUF3800 domain-containing protein [Endozoicomonas sp. G2_2]|uniref:DUF3800 domain-containing protein n=1 Tax=Endozoicomonas sp. G2_2 TaxID=2821092 RepID=UPI001ADC8541|nr:DUF3800 domain-containing protein [Endozoicomonas sp. G2_2]MBO9469981.1 DUF3800 domain-containing protein [Endozoicomonas sp. G2_2]
MHLFYCDESNLESRPGDFFVYGGLVIRGGAASALSKRIEAIRRGAGIDKSFQLKFNPGPDHLSHQNFIDLKQSVLEAAAGCGATLITSFISHDIARNPNEARRNEINRVCYNFDQLLERENECGLVLLDRFDDRQIDSHLREKFSIGVTGLPHARELRLNNILGFHYSAMGQAHFASVVDIVIGSVRFALNVHCRGNTKLSDSAQNLLSLIAPLYERDQSGEIAETSLFFSPKSIRVPRYRQQYASLKKFLGESGINAHQSITA